MKYQCYDSVFNFCGYLISLLIDFSWLCNGSLLVLVVLQLTWALLGQQKPIHMVNIWLILLCERFFFYSDLSSADNVGRTDVSEFRWAVAVTVTDVTQKPLKCVAHRDAGRACKVSRWTDATLSSLGPFTSGQVGMLVFFSVLSRQPWSHTTSWR